MTIYEQVPETKNINSIAGDDLIVKVDFGIDLTGYTFECLIGNQTPVVSITDTLLGRIEITLTATQTATIGVAKVHWYLVWFLAGKKRTVVSGNVNFGAR